jgi:lipopolysaccharide export system ATP-binding protein
MQKLSTEEISKSYKGRQVVRGVSITVSRGEVVGLLGPNGAGKTTSFYMMVGLVAPDGGRILADETEITRVPMYLRARTFGISYLPQEPSVFRKLSVEENILAVLEAQPISGAERRSRTEKLIGQLNLGISERRRAMRSPAERDAAWRLRAACASNPRLSFWTSPFQASTRWPWTICRSLSPHSRPPESAS